MARTIKEIANGMKEAFVGNETLRTHYGLDDFNPSVDYVEFYNQHFSAVSVETCLIYIVAACAAALENMFDWFKQDVNEIVANERYGHKGWYEAKAREFHYTDTNTQEEVYPITHASCEELNFGIKLKVAKGEPGSMVPLETTTPPDDDEMERFIVYMSRIKPSGMPIECISLPPDMLKVAMVVYYDPLIVRGGDVEDTVKKAITSYLQGIDFNGVFTTMEMVDALQKVEGLDIVEVTAVQAKHAGTSYEDIENDTRYVPKAGYMILTDNDAELSIITIPNV